MERVLTDSQGTEIIHKRVFKKSAGNLDKSIEKTYDMNNKK